MPGAALPLRLSRCASRSPTDDVERGDPYRFLPTSATSICISSTRARIAGSGRCSARTSRTIDGERGVAFAVWAPNARARERRRRLLRVGRTPLPDAHAGRVGRVRAVRSRHRAPDALYKFELRTREGDCASRPIRSRSRWSSRPSTASIVVDDERVSRGATTRGCDARHDADHVREPMLIYEVHLGSWARVPEEGESAAHLSRDRAAARRAREALGFTHVELLPVMEHPFYGSWGYQVTGYFAPTSRYGTPDDFRVFRRHAASARHRRDSSIGCRRTFRKDDYALRRFDGTALYEHEDPRLGEHPDWGTLIFNYGRNEVRNFLIANALFWLTSFTSTGCASTPWRRCSISTTAARPGEWLRNSYGGRENLEAIEFLKQFNEAIRIEAPGVHHGRRGVDGVAGRDAADLRRRPRLQLQVEHGLDARHARVLLEGSDPSQVPSRRADLRMIYAISENFIMPLSHDEVVHVKGSLSGRCRATVAEVRQPAAAVRLHVTQPGKKLLFMGGELAAVERMEPRRSLDWHLLHEADRAASGTSWRGSATVSTAPAALHELDFGAAGLRVDRRLGQGDNSVLSFLRRSNDGTCRGGAQPHSDAACAVPHRRARNRPITRVCSTATPRSGAAVDTAVRRL